MENGVLTSNHKTKGKRTGYNHCSIVSSFFFSFRDIANNSGATYILGINKYVNKWQIMEARYLITREINLQISQGRKLELNPRCCIRVRDKGINS